MTQILLNLLLILPCTYEDYVSLKIEAEIDGITVEQFICNQIRDTFLLEGAYIKVLDHETCCDTDSVEERI